MTRLRIVLLIGLACAAGPRAAAATKAGPSLGWLGEIGVASSLPAAGDLDAARPPLVRLIVRWEAIETERGVYDWSAVEPEVAALREAGWGVVLCLTGANPLYAAKGASPSSLEGESLEAWIGFARSAARSFAGSVGVFEIWDRPARGADGEAFDPALYAFVLKSTALALRAEARAAGAAVLVAQGALDSDRLDWQRTLWESDVAPYVDILPVRVEVGGAAGPGPEAALGAAFEAAVLQAPAPALWAYLEPAPGARAAEAAPWAVRAVASSAAAALARAPDPEDLAVAAGWLRGVHAALGEGFAPAPSGDLSFADLSGGSIRGPRVLGRFVSDRDLSTLVVYDAPAGARAGEQGLLVLDVADAREARVEDPASGEGVPSAVGAAPGAPGRRGVGVLFAAHPMLLRFERAAAPPGLDLPREDLEVRTARRLTAEEIIARHQQVQRDQDDRLERFTARGRVDFHFKLAQGGSTVDVSIDSNYFWERGGALEWEQTDYYINGNRVTWKKIPELPLIQPEKVVTLPLDLTLDKTYAYRLVGEDEVSGRAAYVLAFEPADPDAPLSLYRGRVWIDQERFVRLQLSVVQTALEAPVLSNEERDRFEPVTTPEGETFWMLSRIAGQQLWSAGGRNFVVQRELVFREFEINPPRPSFEERRRAAYASQNQMLRDTDRGFRYLERQEDGTRTVKESVDTSQFFAAGGLFKDSSIDSVVPLGGVNYFNYDLFGKGIQTNVFFAGVLGFFNATKPDLFGRKIDAAGEATLFALKRTDKVFEGDVEIEPRRVRYRSQDVSVRLGVPLGEFFKVTLVGDLAFNAYSRDDDTDPSLVLPRDHTVTTGRLQAEFNRRGYSVTVSGAASRRSRWEPWGIAEPGGDFPEFDASHRDFTTWGLAAFKEWYLPKFQKVRAEVNFLDGSDLDRFSQYQFGFFGATRLNGFSGTGVRFDRGTIVRGGYAFNLFEVIRLDAALETARVEDESAGTPPARFTGLGLSGNFVGPWKTVISLGYGRAVGSDIRDLRGKQEFLLVVLKLF